LQTKLAITHLPSSHQL